MDAKYHLEYTTSGGESVSVNVVRYSIYDTRKGERRIGYTMPNGKLVHAAVKTYKGRLLSEYRKRAAYVEGKTATLLGMEKEQLIIIPFKERDNYNGWSSIKRKLHRDSVNPQTGEAEYDWIVTVNRKLKKIYIIRTI